jgi:3'-5' exonuclease
MPLRIYTDIETLPPDEKLREKLNAAKVRKLLRKKSAGEAGEGEGCSEEEFRALALYGEYGRVLSIGVILERDGEIIQRGVLGRDRQTMLFHLEERRTLVGFWKLMRSFNPNRDLVIGHNVFWDIRFIMKRSIINRVQPTVKLSLARYRSQPVYDTMQIWADWDPRNYIGLADLAEVLMLDMTKTEGMDGSKVYERFCQGCHEEIAHYNLQDCELVRAVYKVMEDPEGGGVPDAER